MGTPARVSELMYGVDGSSDEVQIYLHRPTGEVVAVSGEALAAADAPDAGALVSAWQAEELALARRVLADEAGEYVDLPDQCDFDEYRVMECFVADLADRTAAQRLSAAVRGTGAFRRFKQAVRDLDLDDSWQCFRASALRAFIVEWCAVAGVELVDDVGAA